MHHDYEIRLFTIIGNVSLSFSRLGGGLVEQRNLCHETSRARSLTDSGRALAGHQFTGQVAHLPYSTIPPSVQSQFHSWLVSRFHREQI